jgi:hypothetical protein
VRGSGTPTNPTAPRSYQEAIARCRPDEQLTGGACEFGSHAHPGELVGPDQYAKSAETFGAGWKCRDNHISAIAFYLSETKH